MENLIEDEPLFKTKTGKDDMNESPLQTNSKQFAYSADQRQLRISGRSSPFSATYNLWR
jgi:hypothetical protein